MELRQYVIENRNALLPKVQAIYEKHGISVENVTESGATIRLSKGREGLIDAMAEEAELLASLVQTVQTGRVVDLDNPEEVDEEVDDVPPPPPGARSGKWTGTWSPRTFTGTFTEE